jgi:hypothetical protein
LLPPRISMMKLLWLTEAIARLNTDWLRANVEVRGS